MNIDYDAFFDWVQVNPSYKNCDNIQRAFDFAYEKHDLEAIKYLTTNFNCEYYFTGYNIEKIIDGMNQKYDIEFLKWIFDTHTDFDFVEYICFRQQPSHNIIDILARNNRQDILQFLFEYFPALINYDILKLAFESAIHSNTPHTMSYLYDLITEKNLDDGFVYNAIFQSTKSHHLLWMIQTGKLKCRDEYIKRIVKSSCIGTNIFNLRYIFENWPTYFDEINLRDSFQCACLCNHIEVLSWLTQTFPQIDVKFNNNKYFREVLRSDKNGHESAFGRRTWLLTFYQAHELAPIINYIYTIQDAKIVANLIRHIIMHFDVGDLVIDDKYQAQFDATVISTNRVFAMTKSAK